ncbi:conserved oligomeric Golgi complex subunit 7-like isoform X2 [Ptychodera flava]|uniref:conserved oligomeric Golgi complex subunit 7-like isoform X2 n=1 Tax=Ptychodera flava TaxID=63121 RepID=UPI003969F7B5
MDFSKFLDDSFDVKDWVNCAFRTQRDISEQKDALASTLVMKLQLFIQEVNNSIEETSQQALQNLPRVLRDIEAVKQEATFLQEQMQMVKEDIKKVEQDTAQSMQMLLELDAIKSRMQAASTALKEADNWTTLMADIDDLFQCQDVHAIAKKLLAMQNSLSLLAHCGDYEERLQYLETLKNRLETLISPQLIRAFNNHSLESATEYVRIFQSIKRLPELHTYYCRCHKVQWCEQLFDDAVHVVCEMLIETLTGLEPPLHAVIADAMQESPLLVLMDIKQVTRRFSGNLQGALQHVCAREQYEEYIDELLPVIYQPYTSYMLHYEELEKQHLLSLFNDVPMDHSELIDSAEVLAESVTRILNLIQKAVERCMVLTEGFGSCGLIKAIKALFSSYCFEFTRVITNLRARAGLDTSLPSATSVEMTEDWEQFQHALRIIQTLGDALQQTEAFEEELCSAILKHTGKFITFTPSGTPGDSQAKVPMNTFKGFNYLKHSDPIKHAEFIELITLLAEDGKAEILCDVVKQLEHVNEEAHKFAFDIVFQPLNIQLAHLPMMEVWSAEASGAALTADLPAYSLSPMEYITKIGQYLMTLPQQLESFTTQDNMALEKALKMGKLPFPSIEGSHEEETVVDQWIGSIARAAMHHYVEQILKIPKVSSQATKQLTTDIDYLCNVLDALGIPAYSSLTSIETLLKMPVSQYETLADDIDRRLVDAVIGMRSTE